MAGLGQTSTDAAPPNEDVPTQGGTSPPQDMKDTSNAPRDLGQSQDENIRYVLSGQPTGWTTMWANMREYDETKAKDVKDDIDTLLVFVRIACSFQS